MEICNINVWAVAFVLVISPVLCAIVILARYYFYGAESEGIDIRIECDFYELPDSIDKTRAEDIAKDIFYNQKKLSDVYDLDIFM